jgi:hypothetical protein
MTASLYERRGGMFLLNVKMTSSSILEMQKCEWPETLSISFGLPRKLGVEMARPESDVDSIATSLAVHST